MTNNNKLTHVRSIFWILVRKNNAAHLNRTEPRWPTSCKKSDSKGGQGTYVQPSLQSACFTKQSTFCRTTEDHSYLNK